ncbi:hypothetical protein RvVAR0630_18020 [Agrobacterium vitis]|uniref:hypothetical protein n=1 Tax=Agrobacterium vitis TaxID=373 RepID=UPI0015D91F4F|nr:hypothetical protein [Agrobacterium vitis]BCH59178.1 hypothetical protein RvVAR0630_18020 [Agrobacterium vitis]
MLDAPFRLYFIAFLTGSLCQIIKISTFGFWPGLVMLLFVATVGPLIFYRMLRRYWDKKP